MEWKWHTSMKGGMIYDHRSSQRGNGLNGDLTTLDLIRQGELKERTHQRVVTIFCGATLCLHGF